MIARPRIASLIPAALFIFLIELNPAIVITGNSVSKASDFPLAIETVNIRDLTDVSQIVNTLPGLQFTLTPEQTAKLQDFPQIRGLNGNQAQTAMINIRTNVTRSVFLIDGTLATLGETLQNQISGNNISLARGPSPFLRGFDTLTDGTPQRHAEPINLNRFSINDLTVSDPDLFLLARDLSLPAHLHQQDYRGFRDVASIEVLRNRSTIGAGAASLELFGIDAMQGIINSIATNGTVPPQASGMFREFGEAIVEDYGSDPTGMQTFFDNRWNPTLTGMRLQANERLNFFNNQVRYADLFSAADPAAATIRTGLDQQLLNQTTLGETDGGPPRFFYTNEAPVIVENEGEPPTNSFSNVIHQVLPTGSESIQVEALDSICSTVISPDLPYVVIAGIDFADDPGGNDEAVFVGYDYDKNTGRIDPGSNRECFRSQDMRFGFTLTYNPFDSSIYALQLDSGAIRRLEDTGGDSCPDIDVEVGFSLKPYPGLSMRSASFIDEDTLEAEQFYPDCGWQYDDPVIRTVRGIDGEFFPTATGTLLHNIVTRPTIDGLLEIGASHIPVRGSPLTHYNAYDGSTMIASGYFGPGGRDFAALSAPLSDTGNIRIEDPLNGLFSPTRKPLPALGDRLGLTTDTNFLSHGKFKASFSGSPELKLEYDLSSDLSDLLSTRLEAEPFDRFGRSSLTYKLPDFPLIPNRFFARAITTDPLPVQAVDDTFFAIPGVWTYGNVAANDPNHPAARYELLGTSEIDPDGIFRLFGDGSFDLSFPTFSSTFWFDYRIHLGDTSVDYRAFVVPDLDLLKNPRIVADLGIVKILEIYGLEIGGEFFPLYQFALRPKEPLTLISGCESWHWHSPGRPLVAAILTDPVVKISDLAQSFCGYGTLAELPVMTRIIYESTWEDFCDDFP